MKVNDLSKELGVINKDLISFLKEDGYAISSHLQSVTDEMIERAREHFENNSVEVESVEETFVNNEIPVVEYASENVTFHPDDLIPCKSVTPWGLIALGVDKTVYRWNYYGDRDYVKYRDLQALRRTSYVTKPKFIIENADLCYQWRRELGETYKHFLGVDYPEEFFDMPDEKFKTMLNNAPNVIKEVVKVTAMNMIKNQNYPSIQKLTSVDEILGTCLKEFV